MKKGLVIFALFVVSCARSENDQMDSQGFVTHFSDIHSLMTKNVNYWIEIPGVENKSADHLMISILDGGIKICNLTKDWCWPRAPLVVADKEDKSRCVGVLETDVNDKSAAIGSYFASICEFTVEMPSEKDQSIPPGTPVINIWWRAAGQSERTLIMGQLLTHAPAIPHIQSQAQESKSEPTPAEEQEVVCRAYQEKYDRLSEKVKLGNISAMQDRTYALLAANLAGCKIDQSQTKAKTSSSVAMASPRSTLDANSIEIYQIETGSSLNSENKIEMPLSAFEQNETIYVSVRTKGEGVSSELRVKLLDSSGFTISDTTRTVFGGDTDQNLFVISNKEGFKPGQYELEVMLNGSIVNTKALFVIEREVQSTTAGAHESCDSAGNEVCGKPLEQNSNNGAREEGERPIDNTASESELAHEEGKSSKEWRPSLSTVEPSFDCSKARQPSELAICHNDALRQLDANLGFTYKNLINSADERERESLRRDQSSWISLRNSTCEQNSSCLERFIEERIHSLTTGRRQ